MHERTDIHGNAGKVGDLASVMLVRGGDFPALSAEHYL